MDSWTQYLQRDHDAYELREWARRLRWFRFCRAIGGHANDGDQLLLAFRYVDESDLISVWTALGVPRSGLGPLDIGGMSVGVTQLRDRVLLSLSGASGDPFQVTEADVKNAELLERTLGFL